MVTGQIDTNVLPRFAGISTFARLPVVPMIFPGEGDESEEERDASELKCRLEHYNFDVGVVGFPFDAGFNVLTNILWNIMVFDSVVVSEQASRLLRPYNARQDVYPFAVQTVVDCGDFPCNPFDIEEGMKQVEAAADCILSKGKRIITLGGDHTLAYPLLRAHEKVYGPALTLIHFDAHLDTWDTYFGARLTHGTPFRRAAEEGLFNPETSMHVGIRGPLYSSKDLAEDAEFGFKVIHCDDFESIGVSGIVQKIKDRLSSGKDGRDYKEIPVYISVDIDVLDPAFAPGTGTYEPGGMSTREILNIFRQLEGLQLVGADIVEVSPAYDHAEITANAAAMIAYEFACMMGKCCDTFRGMALGDGYREKVKRDMKKGEEVVVVEQEQ
eukprot:Nk52_evm70s239 gene=Nk52_evmTU70s239